MHKSGRTLVPLACALIVSACGGGGGGSSVTIGGFTSFTDLDPGRSATLVAMTREAGYSYDPDTELLTGVDAGSALSTDSSLTLGLDADGAVNLLAIRTPLSSQSFSTANGDLFADLGGGLLAAVSADETRVALAADPIALGWDYQTFGVWDTVLDADSGRIGAFSAGAPTPVLGVPTSGSATYQGLALGFHADATGASSLAFASLRVAADFSARTLALTTSNTTITADLSAYSPAPGLDLTGTLRYAAGTNTFGGDITSANGMSGRADGRFYGPGAEEVGGVFETRGAGTEVYGGAFGGRR